MSLLVEQLKETAKALVDQSLVSSLVPQRGFQFEFEGYTGLPIVIEWEKGIDTGKIVNREKKTGIKEWLGGLAYATGKETNEAEIRQLAGAIVNRIHYNLGIVGEV